MSVPSNSAGTAYHLHWSAQAHSLDPFAGTARRQIATVRIPVQSGLGPSDQQGYSGGIDTIIFTSLFPP